MNRRLFADLLVLVACGTKPSPAPVVVSAKSRPIASATPEPPKPPTKPVVAPVAPPKQPIDPKLKVNSTWLLGASPTELWITISSTHSAVIDRATHCAVESYANSPLIEELGRAATDEAIDELLTKPEMLAAIRDVVGMGMRFGARGRMFSRIVYTPNGHHIFLELRDLVWHSTRERKRRTELRASLGERVWWEPELGRDARRHTLATQAGDAVVILARHRHRKSRAIRAQRQEGRVRPDIRPDDGGEGSHGVCGAPRESDRQLGVAELESVSPNGRYGVMHWEEGRPNKVGAIALTYVGALVDLQTSTVIDTFSDSRAAVDDDGDLLVQAPFLGGGDHLYWQKKGEKKKKLFADGTLMSFDGREAIVSTNRDGTLGARKCDMVKIAKKE